MTRTAGRLTQEETDHYRSAWRRRAAIDEQARLALEHEARAVVPMLAELLKREFGATRVVLFGSLSRGRFQRHSDIDIATCGQPPATYIPALVALWKASDGFEVDLALYESVPTALRAAIDRDGIDL